MSNSKNKQFVVIDGLARSGTTLFHSVMNSQNSITSYRGILVEPLAIRNLNNLFRRQSWVERNLNSDFINPSEISFTPAWNNYFDSNRFKKLTLKNIIRLNQYQIFSLIEWKEILQTDINSFEDIDQIYNEILFATKKNTLSLRWNNCINYYHAWTKRKNHKWISIIRNPEHRAISYQKSHGVSFERSLKFSIKFAEKLSQIYDNDNHRIIYYENFIKYPKKTIQNLNDFLENSDEVQLNKIINSDGQLYRNETSDIVDKGGNRFEGEEFKGFNAPKSYKSSFSFREYLKGYKIYKRYY